MFFCDLQGMLWNEPNLWQNWLQSNIWWISKVSWLWLTHNVTHRSWLTSHWHNMLIFCQTGPFPHLNSKCTGMEAHRSRISFTAAIMTIDSCGMALCSPAMKSSRQSSEVKLSDIEIHLCNWRAAHICDSHQLNNSWNQVKHDYKMHRETETTQLVQEC